VPNKKKIAGQQSNALRIFRGAKGIPQNAVRQYLADSRKKKQTQIEKANATRQQMGKYLGEIQKAANSGPNAKALDALLSMHKKLASRKIAPPMVAGGIGGILAGSISVKVVPPFDYDVIIPEQLAGDPVTTSVSASRLTGQMSMSAMSSSEPGFNGGGMYATVGIYFHPTTAGTLSVSVNPTYSFQWWTNSLQSFDLVQSYGSGALTVYGVDVASQTTGAVGTIETVAGQDFIMWNQQNPAEIQFDAGFDLQTPASLSVDVDPTQVYLLFVEANVDVQGVGWPGSLAGSVLSVTVPYISYDFRMRQVLEAY
jgi:hypothetical protein